MAITPPAGGLFSILLERRSTREHSSPDGILIRERTIVLQSAESKPRDSYTLWRNLWRFSVLLIVRSYPCGDFHIHVHWGRVSWVAFQGVGHSVNLSLDVLRNVVLYVPFRFFYVKWQSNPRTNLVFKTTLLAALVSTSCQFFQIFWHSRTPSMTDVLTNVMGGVMGAVIALTLALKEKQLLIP